jgi:chromosome segregation ATPase
MARMIFSAILFTTVNAAVHTRNHGRFGVHHKSGGNSMIAKIIEMLGEEKDKISADIKKETKTMADYMQYCDDDQSEKAYAIKTAQRKQDELNALVSDNTANINALEEEITELAAEIAERQDEMAKADKTREVEHADFLKKEDEQTIIVAELEKMMIELKHQIASMTTPPPLPVEGGASFVQDDVDPLADAESLLQKGKHVTVNKHVALTQDMLKGQDMHEMLKVMTKLVESFSKNQKSDDAAFLQQDPLAGLGGAAGGSAAGPVEEEAAFDSDASMEAFAGLKKKAEKALQDLRDGEVNSQQAHTMNKQALSDQVMLLKDKEADSKKDKLELSEEKEEALGELAQVAETKKADEGYLEKLVAECTQSSHAWQVRSSEARAEMAAIEKAKEILASRVTVLVQKVQSTKRINSDAPLDLNSAKIRQTLINHFSSLGHRLQSVSMLNMVSVATAQPFDKIKGLIEDLLAKLEKEAEEAANTHAFCEEEKKKNEEGIKKNEDKISQLDARLDKAKAKAAKLAEDIETLTGEVADIAKSQAEATAIREEEKATFEKANADFTEAADAVTDAIDALKDYYGDGGAALLQTSQRQPQGAPQLGGAKKDSGSVIIGMLETMGQEFAKTAADLQATENEAVSAYEKLSQENKVAETAKETEIKGAKSEIATLEVSIGHFSEDHEAHTKELAAIHEYVLSLKVPCYGRVLSFEERQAKRMAELEGLKEALTILEESSPSLIQTAAQLRR